MCLSMVVLPTLIQCRSGPSRSVAGVAAATLGVFDSECPLRHLVRGVGDAQAPLPYVASSSETALERPSANILTLSGESVTEIVRPHEVPSSPWTVTPYVVLDSNTAVIMCPPSQTRQSPSSNLGS